MTSLSAYPAVPQFRYERMHRANQISRFSSLSSANQPINQIENAIHGNLSLLTAAAQSLQQRSPLKLTHQSMPQSLHKSYDHSPINQSINQSVNRSNPNMYLPTKFSAPRLIDEFDSESDSESDQSVSDSDNESNDESIMPSDWSDVSALLSLMDIKESANQSINQSNALSGRNDTLLIQAINQSVNQSLNPLVIQPINQPVSHSNHRSVGPSSFYSPLENAIAITLHEMHQSIDQSISQSIDEYSHRLNVEVLDAINDTESISQFIDESNEAYQSFISARANLHHQSMQSMNQSINHNSMKTAHQSKTHALRAQLASLASREHAEIQARQLEQQRIQELHRQEQEQKQREQEEKERHEKERQDQSIKEEEEKKRQEEEKKQAEEKQQAHPPAAQPINQSINQPNPAQLELQPSIDKWSHVKQLASQFSGPSKLQYKTLINRTLTQISQTVSSVRDKSLAMLKLFQQCRGNDVEHAFVIHTIVTKMIGQCDTRIRVQSSSCFAFAGVLINLVVQDPLFAHCMRAALCEASIYCYPMSLDRKNYASMIEYRQALGFRDAQESEDEYFSRHAGYVTLLGSLMQQAGGAAHPYGLSHAWTWLARMCNSEPRTSTAAMLHAFLQVTAHALYEAYPHQMTKLCTYLHAFILPKLTLQAKTPARKAARTRLELWLKQAIKDIQTHGKLTVPEGKIMQDTQDQDTRTVQVQAGDAEGT